MNYNSKAAFGRLMLYFRTRYGMEISYADMLLLEDLIQAQTSPMIIADFLRDIVHVHLEPQDIEVIKAYRHRQDIINVVQEWSNRPMACCLN